MRFRDPLRVIVSVQVGAGCDVLTLECGHRKVENHRAKWGKRARCFGDGCRIFDADLSETKGSVA